MGARAAGLLVALVAWLVPARFEAQPNQTGVFDFLEPTVHLDAADLTRLDEGQVLVRILPSQPGEIAVLAAVRTTADGPRLVKWVRDISDLKKSSYVTAISRFSSPPQLEDLSSLELSADDFEALQSCRPSSCDLKVTESEAAGLQSALNAARPSDRVAAVRNAFRRLILDRVQDYLHTGLPNSARFVNDGRSISPRQLFSNVLANSVFLVRHAPALVNYLDAYPNAAGSDVESFTYWSVERLAGRRSVIATHVAIIVGNGPGRPEALVAGKELFSLNYVSAALGITAIFPGRSAGVHYLVYLNRTHADILDHWYSGLARFVIDRRISGEAGEVFRGLTARLESGDPPR